MPDCGVREEARHSRAGLLIMPSLRDSVDGYLFLIFISAMVTSSAQRTFWGTLVDPNLPEHVPVAHPYRA